MSASTNNPTGQPTGATLAPSQQPSSHASASPMHAAGAPSVNLPLLPLPMPARNEALQKAIQAYVTKLSDDDKAAFRSAPDIIDHLQDMQRNGKPPISSSLTSRVEKVLQCVKGFMGSLAICIQHSPEISSLVVGGVNCILMVGALRLYSLGLISNILQLRSLS